MNTFWAHCTVMMNSLKDFMSYKNFYWQINTNVCFGSAATAVYPRAPPEITYCHCSVFSENTEVSHFTDDRCFILYLQPSSLCHPIILHVALYKYRKSLTDLCFLYWHILMKM